MYAVACRRGGAENAEMENARKENRHGKRRTAKRTIIKKKKYINNVADPTVLCRQFRDTRIASVTSRRAVRDRREINVRFYFEEPQKIHSIRMHT